MVQLSRKVSWKPTNIWISRLFISVLRLVISLLSKKKAAIVISQVLREIHSNFSRRKPTKIRNFPAAAEAFVVFQRKFSFKLQRYYVFPGNHSAPKEVALFCFTLAEFQISRFLAILSIRTLLKCHFVVSIRLWLDLDAPGELNLSL